MSGHLLPHALLDLALARASARLETLACTSLRRNPASILGRRHAHHQTVVQESTTSYVPHNSEDDRSLYARSRTALATGTVFSRSQEGPLSELEKRILELKEVNAPEGEELLEPLYSESELISVYEDLLATPARAQTQDIAVNDPEALAKQDAETLHTLVHDLYQHEDPAIVPSDARSQYTAVLTKLNEIVTALEAASPSSSRSPPAMVSVLTDEQWVSLTRVCVREEDGPAAESVIALMKRLRTPIPEDVLNTTLSLYATKGDIANTERFIRTLAGPKPSERQRDLHVKAHLRSIAPHTFPTAALTVLHDYETHGIPAPQRSYTRVIATLLRNRTAMAEAQAWDLFAHMRYVAHPTPDAYLYAKMIDACAPRVLEPQPARALDLWTEMTMDKGIPPTAAAYNAVIHACVRSGQKMYVNEAFRIAKEMLDGHRDAYGNPAFPPDRRTFCALLEGAKRVGDLAKVRWILAEIISVQRQAARGDVENPVVVDEQIMLHVFHAYASYRPPFKRSATVVVNESKQAPDAAAVEDTTASPTDEAQDSSSPPDAASPPPPPVAPKTPQFTSLLPQTSAEVLGEAHTLFYRILQEVAPAALETPVIFPEPLASSNMPEAFAHVALGQRLLNAYLSIHYAHAPFEECARLYSVLFKQLAVEKNGYTYVDALERAAKAPRGFERKMALRFAREVWEEWRPVEEAWRAGRSAVHGVNARMVERAYAAMIKVLSLNGQTRDALEVVRAFVELYPPHAVKHAPPRPALRSTETALHAPRPLVRVFSPAEVPDDAVPPLLSFPELEALHHRLVVAGDRQGIKYVKWVTASYEGALRRRRAAAVRAEPVRGRKAVVAKD
ncbi:hypothetical protein PYCCODRAFT_1387874 [Trametes coccinea BRFM310]|uniref:Pentacotripeptide-repeat region of PRORP domain-containing protein n=1 Tax=Trametes coccinea (strain BRFM310) TaxID=1353009 RepID=A0A1Y2ITX5_TRAC3|nr:hypothetical protein PYCCODRAFT_1387874 [Trametes coccinea BRFM310]